MSPESLLAGRYRRERRLAAGGMGEVWLAHDAVLSRDVAVKTLPVGGDVDPAAVERFTIEARAMAALQHPNVVSIFDTGTPTGTAFIVMELLPGPTLAQLVASRGPLPEAEALSLAAQVAAGLAAAHAAGVIHRDIKPGNLMFSSSGMLKILDFGIARLSQATTSALTATNAVVGSAAYLSPEQAAGAPVDERSDLYSLGCVLFTMLTGRPPFTADHPVAVLHQQVNSEPPRLRELRPDVSRSLEALVATLLSKRPELRPASATEVEAQLAAIAAGPAATRPYPVAATPAPRTPQPRTAPSATPTTPAPRRRRRSKWPLALAALAVVIVLVLVSAALLNRGGDQASRPSGPTSSATRTPTPKPSSASPTSTPRPTSTVSARTPMDRVRAAVAAAVADGQMDAKRAQEFLQRLAGNEKGHKGGKKKGGKSGESLSAYLEGLVRKGQLTTAARQRIEDALNSL